MSSPRRDLASVVLELGRRTGLVRRRWCTISAQHVGPPATVDVFIGASAVLTTGVRYNGSVTAPAAGEVWALDVVENVPIAVYKVA